MIVTLLTGGLGNQLFQYATGLATACRRNTNHKLDLRCFGWESSQAKALSSLNSRGLLKHHRTYALSQWNIQANFASRVEVKTIKLFDRLVTTIRPGIPYFARPVVVEQSFNFDPSIYQVPKNCLLVGCWQSEKYFRDIESTLRYEFRPRYQPSSHAEVIAKKIRQQSQSVFVHVRRGDYLLSEIHEVCAVNYYQNAISYIKQRLDSPHFFVFSDEPEWAVKVMADCDNFSLATNPALENQSSTGYEHEDLWLMSLCRHGIISNSSFSWWGAWLNDVEKRIVLAPTRWLRKPTYNSRVFIPERWTTIDG